MRYILGCLILLFGLPMGAQAEQPAGVPDVHVGDRWTFQERNGLTDDVQGEFTRRVVTVTPTEITAVQQIKGHTGQTVGYFSRDWNVEDNGRVRFDPPPMTMHFPMKNGDTWQEQYKARTLANGFTVACHVSSKVVVREPVKVLAGDFDALRIEGRTECRGADGSGLPILFANSNWYAPSVKAIVKTVTSQIFEGRERNKTVIEMLNYSLADRAEPAPGEPSVGHSPAKQVPATPATPSSAPPALPEKGI
jgi:hypothetical protein